MSANPRLVEPCRGHFGWYALRSGFMQFCFYLIPEVIDWGIDGVACCLEFGGEVK